MELKPDLNPFTLFSQWFAEAEKSEMSNYNAMTLATCDATGQPSARTVLLKGHGEDGFIFYTNNTSRKGNALADNNKAALLFYWKSLDRQIRIEGQCQFASDALSDAYFNSRPRLSQIGAHASQQSQPLESRTVIENKIAALDQQFKDQTIPRPDYWGGYCLIPERFQFWQDGEGRIHDSFVTLPDAKVAHGWMTGRVNP